MNPRFRAALAAFFILAFAVTAPIVLLWTSGYRVNWKRQRIEKTGSINIETKPSGARAEIDGAGQRRATPLTVTRLLPEEYTVRVTKDGYLPWEKRLAVRSGETTFATDIRLFRDGVPRLVFAADAEAAAWTSDGSKVAFLRSTDDWNELTVLDVAAPAPGLLARFAPAKYASASLAWSPRNDAVLFTGRTADGGSEVVVYPADAAKPARALHEGFPAETLRPRWSNDGRSVVVVSSAGVFSADADTGETAPLLLLPGVRDAVEASGGLHIVTAPSKEKSPAIERIDGDRRVPVAELPSGDYRFVDGIFPKLAVTDERRNRLIFVGTAEGSFSAAVDASAASPEPRGGKRMLVWSDFEVSIVDPGTGDRLLVTRLGTPVRSCAWHADGTAVLCATDASIFAAELDDRDRRNIHDLVRFTAVGPFALTPLGERLLFIGAAGGQRGIFERDL